MKKTKPGPKPRQPDQLALVVSTRLPPDVRAWLAEQGGGSVTRGLRLVVTAAYVSRPR